MLTHTVLGCICYLIQKFLIDCKTGFFFFLTFLCIITPISRDKYCIMENFKKISGKNNNRLRTMYPKQSITTPGNSLYITIVTQCAELTTVLATFFCHFIYSFIYCHSSVFIYLFIIFGGGTTVTSKCEKLQRDSAITQETSLETNKL